MAAVGEDGSHFNDVLPSFGTTGTGGTGFSGRWQPQARAASFIPQQHLRDGWQVASAADEPFCKQAAASAAPVPLLTTSASSNAAAIHLRFALCQIMPHLSSVLLILRCIHAMVHTDCRRNVDLTDRSEGQK